MRIDLFLFHENTLKRATATYARCKRAISLGKNLWHASNMHVKLQKAVRALTDCMEFFPAKEFKSLLTLSCWFCSQK